MKFEINLNVGMQNTFNINKIISKMDRNSLLLIFFLSINLQNTSLYNMRNSFIMANIVLCVDHYWDVK